MKINNILLHENGTLKKAIFGLTDFDCLQEVKRIRNSDTYMGFDLTIETEKDICLHDNTIQYSECCGRQRNEDLESDLCMDCKEHTGFIVYCTDCEVEL